ncbi:demethylmenaquinone methyltransferase [Alicyclobacillus cellulosilyticus]|uniref:Demethylmenaquinone methyltransferase n=1 Tax=Alicyclobacillus cellulosilyticus TaxID=1003997 RepID=A0A917NM08_9BACL|nr:demethylmenaquinone methyltransferase [Alicyclobacillus cellulosilyticus]GGJ10214.1 demethylmenaquinone methyltransferase [Alicyclobacillus cellulosilyticus]
MVAKEQKASFVHEVFAQIAGQYDWKNSVLSFGQHKVWRAVAMRKLRVPPGARALDVAAGTGDWSLALAKAVGANGHVTGLDFCDDMLEVARRKAAARGLADRISWVHGDAMALPFPDDTFDVATIGFALRNVPDVVQVLREMRRVVKPGGKVVSLELSKPEWPVFRELYYFYFYKVVPRLGAWLVGKEVPYAWLPASLTDFPDRRGLEQRFREAGLTRVVSYALTGGVAALHMGWKDEG